MPTSKTAKIKNFWQWDAQQYKQTGEQLRKYTKLDLPERVELWRQQNDITAEEFEEYKRERDERNRQIEAEKKLEEARKFEEKQRRINELIHSASIPKIFSKKRATDFKISALNEIAVKCLEAVRNNRGFYIYGECGTGKTLLASIIQNERAQLLKSSMFICATDIFQELNPYNGNQEHAMNKRYLIKNTPCLIIDDLGAEKATDWTKQTLFDILNHRYNEELQTIITSNFSLEELRKRLSEYEGARIIRRIKEMCEVIELKNYK